MDRLPQEVVDKIAESLESLLPVGVPSRRERWEMSGCIKVNFPLHHNMLNIVRARAPLCIRENQLGYYAAISRPWQQAIERITFREIMIQVQDLDKATAILDADGQRRRQYVRELHVKLGIVRRFHVCRSDNQARSTWSFMLSEHGDSDEPCTFLSNLHFWWRMRSLLTFVNLGWPGDTNHGSLAIVLHSCWTGAPEQLCRTCHRFPCQGYLVDPPVAPKGHWELPVTPAITGFQVDSDEWLMYGYRLHHGWMGKIKAALPSLREQGWCFDIGVPRPGSTRRDTETSMCAELASLDTSNLRSLRLYLHSMQRGREPWPATHMLRTIRRVSHQLQELHFAGGASPSLPELFWPATRSDNDPITFWPHLQVMTLNISEILKSYHMHLHVAKWDPTDHIYDPHWHLFDWAGPWNDDTNSRGWRLASVPHEFNALMIATSRAMLRMPQLVQLHIKLDDVGLWNMHNASVAVRREGEEDSAIFPFRYDRELIALSGPDARDNVYGPLSDFIDFVDGSWEAPAVVMDNWSMLRRLLLNKAAWRGDVEVK